MGKSPLSNYGVTARGAKEFAQRNATSVQTGYVGIVVKTFSVNKSSSESEGLIRSSGSMVIPSRN
ncbi:hypothetical protein DPX16_0352 [Anabarilius grahami]|uniref:Uncharacterized protein n=1 Tax=Anabarilius grahami TaxID=495550 RepID=A0A3N0XZQ0_ANAGA|nr:hypothetical protein DPX16_0352 [Anabarilius grahami]